LLLFGIPPFDHPKDDWLPLADRLAQLQPWPNDKLLAYLLLNAFRDLGWLGYQGVHLFLVLSGFGLTWSLARRSPDSNVDLRKFYRKRLWRILPLYWAAHLFFLIFHALTGQPEISVLDCRFYLSLAGCRFLPETFYYISPAWWYVGLILQLYLVFPLLWAWLRRQGLFHFWLGTAAITLISRFVLLIIVAQHREMWSMGAVFVTRLFEFTFGMGLAYWLARQPDGLERLWRKRWPLGVACLVYLLALALSFTLVGSIVAHSLIAVSLFGITYFLSQYVILPFAYFGRIIGWLGSQSYGLFILHQPLLWWFILGGMDRIQPYFLFLVTLVLFWILVVMGSAGFSTAVEHASDWVTQPISTLWSLGAGKRAVRNLKREA
jgi:peptidoglycan/LPS O-acetylase OafA/YrhL